MVSENVLEVTDLRTYFYLNDGVLKAVDGVSFAVKKGETLGIIGESGCGKSVTAQSILKIVPAPGRVVSGEIWITTDDGQRVDVGLLDPGSPEIRSIRGKSIAMIFQEPMTSLSPVHTIGNQIVEAIRLHRTKDRSAARKIAIDMIRRVGIPNPEQRVDEYPYQLSGGMRQRAMIAMALSCEPAVLLADEPTTALDVTIQAQILELLKELQEQFRMAVVFITHDLGVISEIADRVAVMYLGRVVEYAPADRIFSNPLHPYTRSLLKSIPRPDEKTEGDLETIRGTVPTPLDFPAICGFYSRCTQAMEGTCDGAVPALVEIEQDHFVRCFLHSPDTEPDVETSPQPAERSRSTTYAKHR